jgi:hypothetical protein
MKIDPKFISESMTDDAELSSLDLKKVNRSGDTMSGSLDLNLNSLLNIKGISVKPLFLDITNVNNNILSNNDSLVFLQGNNSSYHLELPDPNNIIEGSLIFIINNSTNDIDIKLNNSTLFKKLQSQSSVEIVFSGVNFFSITPDQSVTVSSNLVDGIEITNNQSTFIDITNAILPQNTKTAILHYSIERVSGDDNLVQIGELKVINDGINFSVNDTFSGNYSGVDFNVTNNGQLQYKSSNLNPTNYSSKFYIKLISSFEV